MDSRGGTQATRARQSASCGRRRADPLGRDLPVAVLGAIVLSARVRQGVPSPAQHSEECQRGRHLRRRLVHASAQDSAVAEAHQRYRRDRQRNGREHHWPEARLASEAAATRRRGWDTSFGVAAPSPLSATGTNGGVSASVASGLRQQLVTCMPSELQWPPTRRSIISIVNAVLRGGLAVGSLYAQVGLGYAGENIAMLEQIGQVLRAMDRPFVIGGDFNMTADALTASGWLSAVHAKVMHAPNGEATFVGSHGQSSAIDFFVVSNCLVASVNKVWVAEGPTCIRGHRPVSISITPPRGDTVTWQRRRPMPLPVAAPVAPQRLHPQYDEITAAAHSIDPNGGCAETIEELFGAWAAKAETEALDKHDLRDDPRYHGLFTGAKRKSVRV